MPIIKRLLRTRRMTHPVNKPPWSGRVVLEALAKEQLLVSNHVDSVVTVVDYRTKIPRLPSSIP